MKMYNTLRAIVVIINFLLHVNSTLAVQIEKDGIKYNLKNDNTAVVVGASISSVNIPETIQYLFDEYEVVSIGEYAFNNNDRITSVTIPKSIRSIGNCAFNLCYSLSSVVMSEGLLHIDNEAFYLCKNLQSVVVPNTVTAIGNKAFMNSGLCTLKIGSNVESIGEMAFSCCKSLNDIAIDDKNKSYDCRDNCNAIIETQSNTLIAGFTSTTIPYSVTKVGDNAFYMNYGIESMEIPSNVTSIGYQAFYNCVKLSSITIPNGVKSIGNRAFSACGGLKLVVSKILNPYAISDDVFTGSGNRILQVPQGTKSKYEAYSGWTKHFKEIIEETLSDSVEVNGILYKLNHTEKTAEVTFKSENKGDYFGDVNIPQSVDCNGQSYAVTSIGPDAFYNCKELASIVLPNTISEIGDRAFAFSEKMQSINIPKSVRSIGKYIIAGCNSLSSVIVETGNSVYDSRNNCNAIIKIEGNEIIAGCKTTVIPSTVKAIGFGAFSDCKYLSSITIPKSVTRIENGAFMYCERLTKVDMANSGVIVIGQEAFSHCVELSDVPLPNSLTYILQEAFSGCESLLSVVIPKSVIRIEIGAFWGCIRLNSITVENGNPYYDSRDNCNAIIDTFYNILILGCQNTTIPKSVTSLGELSFSYCYGLKSMTIPNSVTSIRDGAFLGCSNLSHIDSKIILPFDIDLSVFYGISSNAVLQVPQSTKSKYEAYSGWTKYFKEIVEEGSSTTTTYSLSITASGNGNALYNGITVRNATCSFTVNEGSSATISFTPDNGYRIASVKVNNTDVTSSVSNNQYTISKIKANTALSVTFEPIPVTTYTLSLKSTGNGYAAYGSTSVRNQTRTFSVNEGTSAAVTFSPDNGNSVSSVKVNGTEVTGQVSGNRYTISNITANTTMEVVFVEDVNALAVDGINYTVTSQANKTVKASGCSTGQVLTVPATVTQNGTTWTVVGIDTDALKSNKELAAVIWNPLAAFTATVSNPNLLLYVKQEQYAPAAIRNVIVDGTAASITLTEAANGNSFYCPQPFTAQKVSYTHKYGMTTGIGESRGWETLALPFDVQTITHETKGAIVPFANWKSGDTSKPFWLYELAGTGFVEASSIKAYTPYIISMPNNAQYDNEWQLKGSVTFAANSVTIGKTENMHTASYQGRTLVPNFTDRDAHEGLYALNVVNDYCTNNSGMTEGSKFVLNMRQIHPFEAYYSMANANAAPYAIGIFEDMATDIRDVYRLPINAHDAVYDLQGRKLETPVKKGVYIQNGKKLIVK